MKRIVHVHVYDNELTANDNLVADYDNLTAYDVYIDPTGGPGNSFDAYSVTVADRYVVEIRISPPEGGE